MGSASEAFYRDALGLEVGVRVEQRKWLFLERVGKLPCWYSGKTREPAQPNSSPFRVEEVDIEAATTALRQRGVRDERPVYHE